MKIEKVNENQIRCTLTREDLANRELKISELAYGTEKAKTLFRDMMRQANFEFGFEAEDIPLMIEAIPLNAECIVLIITKVEDPDELDTRFARFAPSVTEELEEADYDSDDADEVLDLFRRIQADTQETVESTSAGDSLSGETQGEKEVSRMFRMDSLRRTMEVCRLISGNYHGSSSLLKDAANGNYFLSLTSGADLQPEFRRICNIVSEYGTLQRARTGSDRYLAEHCETLIRENAVQALGQ